MDAPPLEGNGKICGGPFSAVQLQTAHLSRRSCQVPCAEVKDVAELSG